MKTNMKGKYFCIICFDAIKKKASQSFGDRIYGCEGISYLLQHTRSRRNLPIQKVLLFTLSDLGRKVFTFLPIILKTELENL